MNTTLVKNTCRVSLVTKDRLDALAATTGRSRSSLIHEAVIQYLDTVK
jgi:predicted DNA-binding protein